MGAIHPRIYWLPFPGIWAIMEGNTTLSTHRTIEAAQAALGAL